ncbi:hypothetical protein [Pseudooceanicola sp. HF7]|uniref:hypothetical protein n=1 Tax=Pseudooceanicola sp. HF7 TaxID=2721560 RepID=UPI00142FD823|nr:hypothetical protein [Pseudooceanicola sp. HF7]NIZ07990.1 hypothetical protein [Pseudooceanicola sp. HF7]
MSLEDALRQRLSATSLPEGGQVTLAGPAEFTTLANINAEAVAYTGEDIYGRQDESFFARIHDDGAAILLIHEKGQAVGYSVVGPAARMTGLFAAETDKGLLFGTAMRAQARGRGWQRCLIRLRSAALFDAGFKAAKAFVSPWNHVSLGNLLEEGMAVVSHDFSYYGQHRFIVEMPVNGWPDSAPGGQSLTLPPQGAIDAHCALLSQGWSGRQVDRISATLSYCRSATC